MSSVLNGRSVFGKFGGRRPPPCRGHSQGGRKFISVMAVFRSHYISRSRFHSNGRSEFSYYLRATLYPKRMFVFWVECSKLFRCHGRIPFFENKITSYVGKNVFSVKNYQISMFCKFGSRERTICESQD